MCQKIWIHTDIMISLFRHVLIFGVVAALRSYPCSWTSLTKWINLENQKVLLCSELFYSTGMFL